MTSAVHLTACLQPEIRFGFPLKKEANGLLVNNLALYSYAWLHTLLKLLQGKRIGLYSIRLVQLFLRNSYNIMEIKLSKVYSGVVE